MTWLTWYLAAGGVTLVVIYAAHRLTKRPDSELLTALAEMSPAEPLFSVVGLLERVVLPLLTVMLVILAWPLAIVWKLKELLASDATSAARATFAVASGDLVERLTVTEIEAREVVEDPLHAVPGKPFGHMHEVWQSFKEGLQPADQVWSFSTRWTTDWGRHELRGGYVIVRGRQVDLHLLTTRRFLDDD